PDAHRDILPLAHRRSAAGGFPFLWTQQDYRLALLRLPCATCLPAAAATPPRPRGVRARRDQRAAGYANGGPARRRRAGRCGGGGGREGCRLRPVTLCR